MTDAVTIRPAAKADAPLIAMVELETMPEFARFVFEGLHPTASLGAVVSWRYSLGGPDSYEWSHIAEVDGAVAGMITAYPRRIAGGALNPEDPAADRMAHLKPFQDAMIPESFLIARLGVLPVFRRLGVAQKMIEAALDRGRAEGCPLASLFVWEDNAPARRLYESLGFEAQKTITLPPHPRLDCCGRSILMTKALSS